MIILTSKLFLFFLIVEEALGKKSNDIVKPGDLENYKFKPPSKKQYEAILKKAKEDDAEEVEQDEVDLTYTIKNATSVRAGTSNTDYRWPYKMSIQIDKAYGKDELATIMSSISTLDKTMKCFKFFVIPPDKKMGGNQDYLFIKRDGKGCHSKLGRRGGRQETVVSDSCFKKLYGTTMHEIMHVLGFYHEHVRPDRDAWVSINFKNIPKGDDTKKLQYEIRPEQQAFDKEYDYESIMHYNLNDVLVVNSKSKKPPGGGVKVGQRDHLSKKDINRLNTMYPCDKKGKPLPQAKPKAKGR